MFEITKRIISGIISEIFFFFGVIFLGSDFAIFLLHHRSYSFDDFIFLMTVFLLGLICTLIGYFFLDYSEKEEDRK